MKISQFKTPATRIEEFFMIWRISVWVKAEGLTSYFSIEWFCYRFGSYRAFSL
jgi:hypothetical protein